MSRNDEEHWVGLAVLNTITGPSITVESMRDEGQCCIKGLIKPEVEYRLKDESC